MGTRGRAMRYCRAASGAVIPRAWNPVVKKALRFLYSTDAGERNPRNPLLGGEHGMGTT